MKHFHLAGLQPNAGRGVVHRNLELPRIFLGKRNFDTESDHFATPNNFEMTAYRPERR
jgi:hypothetical protein